MILHHLNGCAPTPLANYLKALGILRTVAEQLDPEVRGYWEGERFVLASSKSELELLSFFLNRYEPTPIINPWGARSGFYPGSSEKTSREILEQIASSVHRRFSQFRDAIGLTKQLILDQTDGSKPGDSDQDDKRKLIQSLKWNLRGPASSWLEAVIAIVDTTERGVEQPAILGTGGSEGSGSYTAAFMKAIKTCLLDRAWDEALKVSLFADSPAPSMIWNESFGQFVPTGDASPWDLLLAFEGACLIRSSVAKRSEADANRWSASPFFVAPISSGFSSASRIDEFVLNKGKELPGRGEQWFPLWSLPACEAEIANLFVQGRAIASRNRGRSADTNSMSRAVARLGTARGVREFVRFGYLQRNNQAAHFAVPLGRFVTPDKACPPLVCLDDLDAWLPRLRREAREKESPARLLQAERRLEDVILAATQHSDEPLRWLEVLLGLGEIEAIQNTGSGFAAGPIPRLRPEWVSVADDGSPELRLAVACALQARDFDRSNRPVRGSEVRRHWVTLKNGRFATSGSVGQQRLLPGVDRVLQGRSGIDDAIALVTRRLVEAAQHGSGQLPLRAARDAGAHAGDLALLVAGEIDLERVLALARPLMAIDGTAWARAAHHLRAARYDAPDDAWIIVRLATYPLSLPNGAHVGLDPAIVRRLESGDAASAVTLAIRKLHAAGINAAVRAANVPPATARLWAAALAFPITARTAKRLLNRIDPHSTKETAA